MDRILLVDLFGARAAAGSAAAVLRRESQLNNRDHPRKKHDSRSQARPVFARPYSSV